MTDSARSAVPEVIDRFLARYVDSVEQLEILLLLASHPSRRWSAEEVAAAVYSTPDSVLRRLGRLLADGLFQLGSTSDPGYYYAPRTPELAEAVQQLESCYRERRVAIITLIASRPMDNVRAFSDAFRLRDPKKP